MDKFKTEDVLTDMNIGTPKGILKVTYDDINVEPGMVLTPTQVQHQPRVQWSANDGDFYTLIMNDPDAPSRAKPKFREYHHWMIGNIPGSDISKGEILSDYIGAGPPSGTGLHRYVFLVYKQQKKEDFSGEPHLSKTTGTGRPSHRAADHVSKYNLEGPIAANFFQAEYDDYCPKLYKQLAD